MTIKNISTAKAISYWLPGIDAYNCKPKLIANLMILAQNLATPLHITSSYRTAFQNQKVGGIKNSAHLKGLAVDIKCDNSAFRYQLVLQALLLPCAFRRIGIGKTFVHLDLDDTKPQEVIWLY